MIQITCENEHTTEVDETSLPANWYSNWYCPICASEITIKVLDKQ